MPQAVFAAPLRPPFDHLINPPLHPQVLATHWSFDTCNRCMVAAAVAALVMCYVTGSADDYVPRRVLGVHLLLSVMT